MVKERTTNGHVKEIERKSFCLINNRGYGDVMATVALADHLKRRGAKHISLGVDCARDINAFRFFTALDHIYNIEGRLGFSRVLDFNYDYVISQNWFSFNGNHTFYSQRFECVSGAKIQRPSLFIPDNIQDYAINDLLPSLGLKPFHYIAFHPQANHKTRTLNHDSIKKVVEMNSFPVVLIGNEIDSKDCVNFSHGRSMEETLILLYYSRAFIGVCSCWSHFAWALWKECFVFFSDTNQGNMWGNYHGRISNVECGGCTSGISIDNWEPFKSFLIRFGLG